MDQKEQLKEFGEKLRKIRESKDISLHRIFEITRNDLKYLQAIEQGNFDIMPEVYMKALLKEYADVLGLNPDEVVEEFVAIKENKQEEEQPQSGETVQAGESEETPKKVFEETALGLNAEAEDLAKSASLSNDKKIIIGVAVIAILLIAYFIFKPEKPKVLVKETPYKEVIKNQSGEKQKPAVEQQTTNKTTKQPAESKKQQRLGTLTLVISGTDTSWVRVTADGKLKGEFLIYPGVTKSFGAEKYFTVLAGNSGGIKLTLNDSVLTFSGKKGRVRNLYVDKDGVKYLRISKKKNNE